MKVKVLQTFGDKDNFTKKYKAGETYEFEDARVAELIAKKLVQKVDVKPK